MRDVVEAALEAAEDREADGEGVDVAEFGPVEVAVLGVGAPGRRRLAGLASVAAGWDGGADQVRTGVPPADAPGSGTLRAHPGGPVPDPDSADLLVATGHVHAAADRRRLRALAGRAAGDATAVALPTVAPDARESAAAVASDLHGPFDAVVPVDAGRAEEAPLGPGPADATAADRAAVAVAVPLVEPLPVGAHRPVTPHQPLLPLLDAAGPGVAHAGTAGADAPPAALVEDALGRPLAAGGAGGDDGGGADGGVVAHLVTGPDIALSEADAIRGALSEAVGGEDAVPQYVGVAPDREDGADRRAVVVTFEGA